MDIIRNRRELPMAAILEREQQATASAEAGNGEICQDYKIPDHDHNMNVKVVTQSTETGTATNGSVTFNR
jgi:hypothetical protein